MPMMATSAPFRSALVRAIGSPMKLGVCSSSIGTSVLLTALRSETNFIGLPSGWMELDENGWAKVCDSHGGNRPTGLLGDRHVHNRADDQGMVSGDYAAVDAALQPGQRIVYQWNVVSPWRPADGAELIS